MEENIDTPIYCNIQSHNTVSIFQSNISIFISSFYFYFLQLKMVIFVLKLKLGQVVGDIFHLHGSSRSTRPSNKNGRVLYETGWSV